MKSAKVLLVEDNCINQKVVVAFLSKWGHQVTIANHGKEALILITSKSYQIILMDLQMPEMDGYESTTRIRSMEDPYYKNIPIIAFSASSDITSKEKAVEFGMTDFISKPLILEDFRSKVDQYL